jgi:hypothetical protein
LIVSLKVRTTTQAKSLKLRYDVLRNMKIMRKIDMAAGIQSARERELNLLRHGLLPPRSAFTQLSRWAARCIVAVGTPEGC